MFPNPNQLTPAFVTLDDSSFLNGVLIDFGMKHKFL